MSKQKMEFRSYLVWDQFLTGVASAMLIAALVMVTACSSTSPRYIPKTLPEITAHSYLLIEVLANEIGNAKRTGLIDDEKKHKLLDDLQEVQNGFRELERQIGYIERLRMEGENHEDEQADAFARYDILDAQLRLLSKTIMTLGSMDGASYDQQSRYGTESDQRVNGIKFSSAKPAFINPTIRNISRSI